MFTIIGSILVFVAVFVPYVMSGGSMHIIFHACMFELPTILGASIGALIIGNKADVLKRAIKDLGTNVKGTVWGKKDYQDILVIMFTISKTAKTKGMLALEAHMEKPDESTIFKDYAKILHDHHVMSLICDTFRMITMGFDDPYQVDDFLDKQLARHHHDITAGSGALSSMSDGLPAIGIVAAVLGVVKTMASIDKPPNILGAMIGSALVGTFLGVFLSYCFVAPFASKAKACHEEDGSFYSIVKEMLIATLKGSPPQIVAEIGRSIVPEKYKPTFFELEAILNEVKAA